jgi:diguanylate cyclase (GGDEF)-like protein
MDPRTAVVLMTLNLATTGALVALVARRSSEQQPLLFCAASTGLFACAFALRLWLGMDSAHPLGVAADGLMALAAGLFLHGQRRYLKRSDTSVRPWLVVALVFVLAQAALTTLWGQQARHIALNGMLGSLYLAMAFTAWQGLRLLPAGERAAQGLMLGTAGVLGAATLLRAADAALRGVAPLFVGPTAQAYYALSSICILLMGPSVLWWMFVRLNGRLEQLAIHDPLTGVFNRNGLKQALQRHFGPRTPAPLTWIIADIDHFKAVNDRHGHGVGDRLLQAVAQALGRHVRGDDFVARLGGEEFVVAVSAVTPAQAMLLGERLRCEVESLRLPLADGAGLQCTASFGLSPPFERLAAWETALQAADAALYRAKGAGRNQVQAGGAPLAAAAASA